MEILKKLSRLDVARISEAEFLRFKKEAVQSTRGLSHEARHQVVMQFAVLKKAIEAYGYGREEILTYADRIIDIYHSGMTRREAVLEDLVTTVSEWFEEHRPRRRAKRERDESGGEGL